MSIAAQRSMTAAEWGLLIGLSVLWGGSFFFTEVALRELPAFTLVLLRVGVAALVLNLAVVATGLRMPKSPGIWAAFIGMGLLNNALPFCLIVWGQTQIASGLAAILNATTPLWAVVVAHFLTADEKMSGNRIGGVLAGLAGVAVMVGPALLAELGTDASAQLAVIGAALSYALAGIYGRRFRRMGVAPMVTATGQVTASTFMLLPVPLLADQPWQLPLPGAATVGAVFGMAVLSTALGYVIYFRLLSSAGATNLMLVTFLIPLSAILLGAVVLQERLAPRHFAGMALIGAGLAAIDGRLLPRKRGMPPGPRGRDIRERPGG
jgi:drug/metabolite transporter (DMT)-like permease